MALMDEGDSDTMRELRRQAAGYRSLDPADERRLLERAALGDRSSEDRLVAAHLGMIVRLAGERGAQQSLSLADLVQEGSVGLVEAVRTFANHGRGDFAGFAAQKVAAQIDAAIAAEAAAVRDAELLVAAATDYERAEVVLRRELDREPSIDEIAEKLEWTIPRARYVEQVVAEARRRHDEDMIAFIDPEAVDLGEEDGDERAEFDA